MTRAPEWKPTGETCRVTLRRSPYSEPVEVVGQIEAGEDGRRRVSFDVPEGFGGVVMGSAWLQSKGKP